MPKLATESITRPSNNLGTFVTFVEVCFNVTRPAEEFVREDDIVQLDLDLTNRTLEAVLVPGQCLTTVRVHLHTSFSLDLHLAIVTSG